MPNPVTGLTATQSTAGIPEIDLDWSHDGVDLHRFMLGFKRDDEWVNLEPQLAAVYGAGPYSATVASPPDATWRVVAISSSGEVSA